MFHGQELRKVISVEGVKLTSQPLLKPERYLGTAALLTAVAQVRAFCSVDHLFQHADAN